MFHDVTQEQISRDGFDDFLDDNGPTLNPFAEEFYPTVPRTTNIASSEHLYNGAFGDSSCELFTRPIQEYQHSHHPQDSCSELSKSSNSSFESPSKIFGSQRPYEVYNSAVNISSIKQTGPFSSANAVKDWKTELDDYSNERCDGDGNSSQHGMAASSEQVQKVGSAFY